MADALDAGLGEAPDSQSARPQTVVQEVVKEVIREVQVEVAGVGLHHDHRQAPALGPAGLRQRRRPGGAGCGEPRRRSDCRRQHPCMPRCAAKPSLAPKAMPRPAFFPCMEPGCFPSQAPTARPKTPCPDKVRGKPAQIRLEGERLVFWIAHQNLRLIVERTATMAKIIVVTSGKGASAKQPPARASLRAWPCAATRRP